MKKTSIDLRAFEEWDTFDEEVLDYFDQLEIPAIRCRACGVVYRINESKNGKCPYCNGMRKRPKWRK